MTVYARIGNLSEGGLFLRTNTPFLPGTRATVRFTDGEEREVSVPVTVMWTNERGDGGPPGMGLRFERLDEKSLDLIRQIIIGEQQHAPGLPVG